MVTMFPENGGAYLQWWEKMCSEKTWTMYHTNVNFYSINLSEV